MSVLRRPSPSADRLRADIDRGRARDKIAVFDPAAAPLGTDAEAAGTPPDRDAVAAAEREEIGHAPPRADASDGRTLVARSAQMLAAIVIPAALLWLLFA